VAISAIEPRHGCAKAQIAPVAGLPRAAFQNQGSVGWQSLRLPSGSTPWWRRLRPPRAILTAQNRFNVFEMWDRDWQTEGFTWSLVQLPRRGNTDRPNEGDKFKDHALTLTPDKDPRSRSYLLHVRRGIRGPGRSL